MESLVGFVELKQGNFDLFNPPTFTGAGQKFQMSASVGTLLQDYEMNFIEPWFLGKRLAWAWICSIRSWITTALNNHVHEAV